MIELPPIRMPRHRPDKVYIRFGRWSGRSYNHHTGQKEAGISVYNAQFTDDGLVELLYDVDISARHVDVIRGRFAFVVTGDYVGTGSDGEPLLRNVRNLPYAIAFGSMPCGIEEKV